MRTNCRGWVAGVVLSLLSALALSGTAQADEILDEIDEAVRLYKAGDFSGAVSSLEFAAQQIRQQMAGEVSAALPDPLPGWEAEDAETTAMGAAMFGGGITAERSYTKDDASVDIQIVGDSPMLQMAMGMFNNPMMLSAGGKKLIKIKGQKASMEYDSDSGDGEIMVVVANSVLVTVSGYGASQEDLTAYAEGVRYELIEEFVNK